MANYLPYFTATAWIISNAAESQKQDGCYLPEAELCMNDSCPEWKGEAFNPNGKCGRAKRLAMPASARSVRLTI